jgi:hypothetical protein
MGLVAAEGNFGSNAGAFLLWLILDIHPLFALT